MLGIRTPRSEVKTDVVTGAHKTKISAGIYWGIKSSR